MHVHRSGGQACINACPWMSGTDLEKCIFLQMQQYRPAPSRRPRSNACTEQRGHTEQKQNNGVRPETEQRGQNNGVRPVLMHIEHRRRARVNAYLPIGIYTGLPLSAWAPTFPAQPLFGFGSSRACSAIAWPAVRKGPAKLMELATMSHRDARTLSHGVAALGAPVTRKPGMRQELKRAQNACMQA